YYTCSANIFYYINNFAVFGISVHNITQFLIAKISNKCLFYILYITFLLKYPCYVRPAYICPVGFRPYFIIIHIKAIFVDGMNDSLYAFFPGFFLQGQEIFQIIGIRIKVIG